MIINFQFDAADYYSYFIAFQQYIRLFQLRLPQPASFKIMLKLKFFSTFNFVTVFFLFLLLLFLLLLHIIFLKKIIFALCWTSISQTIWLLNEICCWIFPCKVVTSEKLCIKLNNRENFSNFKTIHFIN